MKIILKMYAMINIIEAARVFFLKKITKVGMTLFLIKGFLKNLTVG